MFSPILGSDVPISQHRVTRHLGRPIPLCPDGFLRPFLFNFIVDISPKNASTNSALHSAISYLADFIEAKFGIESQRIRLNIFGMDSEGQKGMAQNVPIEQFRANLEAIGSDANHSKSANGPPKLGKAISLVSAISREQAIPGVNQIILAISEDGLSRDKVEFDGQGGAQHFVAISLASPRSELLRNLAGGSATRVIHFADWNGPTVGDQFGRWLAFAICEAIKGGRTTEMWRKMTTQMPKWRKLLTANDEPNNVILRPISASSLSVSWTCCSNPSSNYSILISPDPSLPFPSKWSKREANCRHSFGLILDALPTNADYTVCVLSDKMEARIGGDGKLADLVDFGRQCDRIWLSKAEAEHAQRAPFPCSQNGGGPKTTTTPSLPLPLPCQGPRPIEGKCPKGYAQNGRGECIDVDECGEGAGNGGCSHGCVNTQGGHYCACPPPLVLDPANPLQCIPVRGGLARAADLLGHLAKWVQKEENAN